MGNYSVTILPENTAVTVPEGTSLLMAAKKAGVDIESPCGGHGTCGKCAVKLLEGTAPESPDAHLPLELKRQGYILACKTQVNGDMVIEVPQFSRLTRHSVLLAGGEEGADGAETAQQPSPVNPLCKKLILRLPSPTLEDNMNDLDRVKSVLASEYQIRQVDIHYHCLRQLPEILRQGAWTVTVTLVQQREYGWEILRVEPGVSLKPAFGLAVDIGTTTVAVSLVDLSSGKVVGRAGSYNRQAVYGSDVISRIVFADENPQGLELLHKAVMETVNGLVGELLTKHELHQEDITTAVCGGNTVMTHMLLKVDPRYLRLEPYTPAAIQFPTARAGELELGIHPAAPVVTLPSVASYVGGDITAGVLATRLAHSDKLTLFIDIGTNGELVLGNQEWMVTCSCSAGPAFEGSGIRCGMRAMDGAIDCIHIEPDTWEVECRTIGDSKPLGVCGSGLIYSLSEMMEAGLIDRAGNLIQTKSSRRIRRGEEGPEYVLVFSGESGSGQDIVVTEGDIKNLLRAKGAIFAGIRTMLQQVQLDVDNIDHVYIAGGFGNYINIPDAIHIGLLPDLPHDKYRYVGNSCIQGAEIALMNSESLRECEDIAGRMTYLELSVGNLFMEEFISALFIPHTDLALFPSVTGKGAGRQEDGEI